MQYTSVHQNGGENRRQPAVVLSDCRKNPLCPSRAFLAMANWTRDLLLVAVPLSMNFGRVDERKKNNVGWPLPNEELLAASLREPEICYILDGILFLYGIILTALYCRIKIYNTREENLMRKQQQGVEEGIYTGLTPHAQDTYETIGMKK